MNSTFRTIGAWTALAGSAFGGQLSPKDDGPESKQTLSALTIPERPATAYADKSEPKGALELDTSGAKLSFNASSQVVSQSRTSSGIVLYDAPGIQSSLTATLSTVFVQSPGGARKACAGSQRLRYSGGESSTRSKLGGVHEAGVRD
jgi:hypothetical protein